MNKVKYLLTIERTFYYDTPMSKWRTTEGVQRRLAAFFRENRRMPTYAEMMVLLEVRSKSVVYFWVQKLISKGLLERDRRHLRPAHRAFPLPLVGDIQAGLPAPAEEELRDVVSLDEYLITSPDSTFLVRVRGDSMIDEGIMEGDLVLVEKDREAKSGDIVLAEVDGQWTMKYLRTRGGDTILESANRNYPPIRARSELRLGGVITAVLRKYIRGSIGHR
jgi:repressor LexA